MKITKKELESYLTDIERKFYSIESRRGRLVLTMYNADDCAKLDGLPFHFTELRKVGTFPGKYLVKRKDTAEEDLGSGSQKSRSATADAGTEALSDTAKVASDGQDDLAEETEESRRKRESFSKMSRLDLSDLHAPCDSGMSDSKRFRFSDDTYGCAQLRGRVHQTNRRYFQ